MLVRAERREQSAESRGGSDQGTLRNAHTPACNVGQGRRMRCYKPAPCSLSSCFISSCMQIGTYRRRVHPPGDLSVGSGRRCCFIGKAHQTFGFYSSGGSVSVVCRCWDASSMARCAARRPLSSRYQFSSHASSAIITALHRTAHSRVGTADSSSLLSCWLARVESPCLLQGLFLWPSWPRESFSPVRETFPRPP